MKYLVIRQNLIRIIWFGSQNKEVEKKEEEREYRGSSKITTYCEEHRDD